LTTRRRHFKIFGERIKLTIDDVDWPEYCPVFGTLLYYGLNHKWEIPREHTPSIDRIVPEKGYVKGNIAVISWRANELKRDGTVEEFSKLLDWMRWVK
jgi:hypothetical protein